MTDLVNKKCLPCEVGVPPIEGLEAQKYLAEIPDWKITDDGKKLKREFTFESFKKSIAFVQKVADCAESEGHHPEIYINYKKVILELTTHNIGGLSENDFILAAKIDVLM